MTPYCTMTDAELAAWESMARDGTLAKYIDTCPPVTFRDRALLQAEYRRRLAGIFLPSRSVR